MGKSQNPDSRRQLPLLGAGVLIAIIVAGTILGRTWLGNSGVSMPVGSNPALRIPLGARLPDFNLHASSGALTRDSLAGHWTFLYFGYTHCPDACPTTLALLGRMTDALAARKDAVVPQVLFVSVDPQRDTLAGLAEYTAAFGPMIHGATGSDAEIAPLANAMGAYYQRLPPAKDPSVYTVDHSAAVFLVDPSGNLRARIEPPMTLPDLTRQYLQTVGGGRATPAPQSG